MLVMITPRFINFKGKISFKEFDMCCKLGIQLVSVYVFNTGILELCDGLILTGSIINVNPRYYGGVDNGNPLDEYKLDRRLLNYFVLNSKSVLGICGG